MSEEQDELKRLRHKKMAQMMKRIDTQKKEEELKKTKTDKTDKFLTILMMPDALNYYKTQILPHRPLIAKRILEILQYLVQTENLQSKLTKEELIIIDRKLSGIGPNIKIKRSGKEYTDIATELRRKK
ncbi:MAG: hypothetical protein HWN65_13120 [Candidatus Helarchaeota archaeon]|nr:hypothetical protein [Candidatus Helarchaeota archaeon]